jgi:3-phenylpropionate/cinnamic acid dioxygenase small subunit
VTEVMSSTDHLNSLRVRCEVEQFYAFQMQVLDEGDATAWAATFTDTGVFVPHLAADQLTGRAQLEAGAAKAISRLNADGVTRRHIVSNICVEQVSVDIVRVSSYVPVIDTMSGEARIKCNTVMNDELVRHGTTWLVRHRKVLRDDLSR